MRRFRQGRIFLVLAAVACGKQTFDLLPSDTVPIASDAGGAANTGGEPVYSAGVDGAGQTSAATGGSESAGAGEGGGSNLPPPPSNGGVPEGPGIGGTPDWGPLAGGPTGGHCERPTSECSAASPMCVRCNPEQPNRNYDCEGYELVPLCHPSQRRCVQCIPPNGPDDPGVNTCAEGDVCELLTATCRPICGGSNPPCPAQFPNCRLLDASFGICSECTQHDHCSGRGDTTLCSLAGTCVQCTFNADCKDPAAPVCADYRCRPCESECECGRQQWCERSTGRCYPH